MKLKLGIRGKLFVLSLGIIVATVLVIGAYVSSELQEAIEDRMASDLRVRAELIGHDLEARAGATDWQALSEELGRKALARASLVGPDGKLLGDSEVSHAELAKVENHADRPEIIAALKTGFGTATRDSTTIHHALLYVAVRVSDGRGAVAVVRLSQSLEPLDAAVARSRHLLFVGALFAVGIAGLLSSLGSHLLSRSIRELTTAAGAMVEDLSVRTRLRSGDEVGALAEALDRLADNLSGSLARLASERDRLGAILETMADGVLLTDPTGRIALANASLRAMLGTSGQIVGKQPIEAIRNAELAEIIDEVARTEKAASDELEVMGIVPRRVKIRAAPLAGEGARGVVAVLSDVTDLRRLESMRRDFVANVSHELRTPIAAIRAASETLEGGALDDPDAAREFLAIIARHGERLHQLVEDLLALSRIEAHKLELEPAAIDLESFLEEVVELYALSASRHGVTLRATGCPQGLSVTADRRALEQAVSNLVDNAIKYAAGAKVTLSAERIEGEVRVVVADTGPGIAETHLPRLFERFYRVDRGRSRDVGGTGLGLSIVKHLTEALGGAVTVESAVGRGSTFTIHLPVPALGEKPSEPARSDDVHPHQP